MPSTKPHKTMIRNKKEHHSTLSSNKRKNHQTIKECKGRKSRRERSCSHEPKQKRKKYSTAKKSRCRSKQMKNTFRAKNRDKKTHQTTLSDKDLGESVSYLYSNSTRASTCESCQSCQSIFSTIDLTNSNTQFQQYLNDEDFNENSRRSDQASQIQLERRDSQKFRAISELEGVKFIKNDSGSTTEISFKPALVMHVKQQSSNKNCQEESKKDPEDIIVVNPSNNLLKDLSVGKMQRLYKASSNNLLRQALKNSCSTLLVNDIKMESQWNVTQQNIVNTADSQTRSMEGFSPSQLKKGSKSSVLRVKSSKNFISDTVNSQKTTHRSVQLTNFRVILPPQAIQDSSINSFFAPSTINNSPAHFSEGQSSLMDTTLETKRDYSTLCNNPEAGDQGDPALRVESPSTCSNQHYNPFSTDKQ